MEELEYRKRHLIFFFDKIIMERLFHETNKYTAKVAGSAEPPQGVVLSASARWPPQWANRWEDIDTESMERAIVFLLWGSLNKTASEMELFSESWMLHKPGV